MTEAQEPPPTAPGRRGLPAATAPTVRQPPSRSRVKARVVAAGAVAALAVGGTGGALTSLLGSVEASGPTGNQVVAVTPPPASPTVHHIAPARASDDRGEQD